MSGALCDHLLNRCLQARLGVDEKLRRRHDPITLAQTFEDLDKTAAFMPNLDIPRCKASISQIDDYDATLTGPQHCLGRNDQGLASHRGMESHGAKHPCPEKPVGIRELDFGPKGSGDFGKLRLDEADCPPEDLSWKVRKLHFGRATDGNLCHLVFEDLNRQPQGPQIGYVIHLHSWVYRHALETFHPLHHNTAGRGHHLKGSEYLSGLLQALDLCERDIPVSETLACRINQGTCPSPGSGP